MGFLFKFKFDCKSCGKSSKAKLKVKSKFLLEQELGDKLELVCSKCHEKQYVRIKGLNPVINPFLIAVLVIVFITSDYLLINFLFENYWRPDIALFNRSISVLFFGISLPMVLLVFTLRQIEAVKNRLNRTM